MQILRNRTRKTITSRIELENHYKKMRRKADRAAKNLPQDEVEKYLEGKSSLPIKLQWQFHQLAETVELMKSYGLTDEDIKKLDSEEWIKEHNSKRVRFQQDLKARFERFDTVQQWGWIIALSGVAFVLIGIFVVYRDLSLSKAIDNVVHDFYANLGAGAFGTALTILLIDNIYKKRERRGRKASLIVQMKHPDWNLAYQAFGEAVKERFFTDGSLEGEDLSNLNLHSTVYQFAKLSAANLYNAKFFKCHWVHCDFSGASFVHANFQEAELYGCNFRNTSLSGADFRGANLQEVQLLGAHFIAPDIEQAQFSPTTRLPDGKMWTADTDMRYFTDYGYPGGHWKPWKPEDKKGILVTLVNQRLITSGRRWDIASYGSSQEESTNHARTYSR